MKTINLVGGIPSEGIQNLEESIYEILCGLDRYNTDLVCSILDMDKSIEEIEDKLIFEFFQGLKDTLVKNGYKDLLTERAIMICATDYVKGYVVN